MKINSFHVVGVLAILLWIGMNAGETSFGFYPMNTAEAVGYNFGHLLLIFIGVILIVTGFKKGSSGKDISNKE